MSFDLPSLDGTVAPAFTTAEECKRWLGDQTLTNPAFMQRQLTEQIDLLNRRVVSVAERFGMLEAMRGQIAFVQEEVSKRYAAKPFPNLKQEAEAFTETMALWQTLTVAYMRCLEDAAAEAAKPEILTKLTTRALVTQHATQLDRVRGFAQPDAMFWSRQHQLLAFAERHDIATTATTDSAVYGEQAITPLSVYTESILLHAASAHEFSSRPLNWVVRWARRWSGKLGLRTEPPVDLQAVPINVDLTSSAPPSPFPIKSAALRFLDTTELSKSIKSRLIALANGKLPADLQLGDDCPQPACEQMLQRLYQRWCKGGMQRPTNRQAASGTVSLATDMETIWFHIGGNPFKQPQANADDLRRQREEIATFGRISERHNTQIMDLAKLRVDADWQIINEAPGGLRLLRTRMDEDSMRVGIGQLIAVRKSATTPFSLGSVRWLMLDEEGVLHAGVNLLPGVAQAISIRAAGVNAAKDPWRPAFVLQQQGSATQVVIPSSMFRANRVIDIQSGDVMQYKLAALLERGDDFERATVA